MAKFSALIFSSPLLLLLALVEIVILRDNRHVNCVAPPPAALEDDIKEAESMLGMKSDDIRMRMKSLYELIDLNNDKVLDNDEMHAWLVKSRQSMQKKQVIAEMGTIDKDKDGKVTFHEMKNAYAEADGSQAPLETLDELRKRFDAVDKDKDGGLSLDEIGLLMNPGSDEELMELEIREILAAQDKDKDSRISLTEFMSADEDLGAEEIKQFETEFATYDTNGDGFIDQDEIRKVVSEPHQQEIQDSEAEIRRISALKDDETLSITFDDWEKNVFKYAISPASDNGEIIRYPEDYSLDVSFKNIPKSDGMPDDSQIDSELDEDILQEEL